MTTRSFVVVAVAVLCSAAHVKASWLSKITGIDINIPAGTIQFSAPRPQDIPEMIANLPRDVGQALLNPAGSVLATAIRHAASQARHGAQPLPSDVAEGLSRFFPPHVIGRARWTVYDPQRITIDSAIRNLWGPDAITLDDVVVFRSPPSSPRSWSLWAHELVHVGQFHNMGVEGFANVYSVAWNSLERPAYDWGRYVGQQKANERPSLVVPREYWSVEPTAFRQPLRSADFSRAARTYYPPASCARWVTVMGGAQVSNICPVPIAITGWQQINPWTGQPYVSTCVTNCVVGAGLVKPFISTTPGVWTDVYFRY